MHAIVFDFDGVIADSEPAHERAYLRAARQRGMDFSHTLYVQRYVGLDDWTVFARLGLDHGFKLSDEQLRGLVVQKQKFFEEALAKGEIDLWPGVDNLIRSAGRIAQVGLCSAARRSEIEPVLAKHGLSKCFRAVITIDDVAAGKPDPAGYALTVKRLEVAPARAVAIEDTPVGLAAARGAGLRTLGVAHTMDADSLSAADRVVENLEAITAQNVLELAAG